MQPSHLLEGIKLFNRQAFFEAHEVLEDVWRASPKSEKKFLQGMIQIAVGLHHYGNGNLVGARSLLGRAAQNLASYPENFGGIRMTQLLIRLAEWQQALAENKPPPPFPILDVELESSQ